MLQNIDNNIQGEHTQRTLIKFCSNIWTVRVEFNKKVLTKSRLLRNGKYALNKKKIGRELKS